MTTTYPTCDHMSLFDDDDDDSTTRGTVVTVRPGRRLFVRRIVLQGTTHPPRVDGDSTAPTPSAPPPPPTLVFVHGSCATERQYHRLVKAMMRQEEDDDDGLIINDPGNQPSLSFPEGTTCVLYDLAGCGQSPPPTRARDDDDDDDDDEGLRPDKLGWMGSFLLAGLDSTLYSNSESILDLKAILSGAASPVFLVGHSYASNLIVPLARGLSSASHETEGTVQGPRPANPTPSLAGVILLSGGMRTPGNPIPDGGSSLIRSIPVPILNCLQSSLTSGFVSAAVHPESAKSNPDIANDLVGYCNANRMEVVKAYHSEMKWCAMPEPSTSTLGEGGMGLDVRVPILVLHGDQDNIIPIQAGQEMANLLRGEFVVVRNVSHMIMMEAPREVASHIRTFVVGRRSG